MYRTSTAEAVSGGGEGVCRVAAQRGLPRRGWCTESLTHACENITFPQLLLRTATKKCNLSWTFFPFVCCSKSSVRSEGGWDSRLARQQTSGGEVSATFTLRIKPCSHCASTFSSAVLFDRFKAHSHRAKAKISFDVFCFRWVWTSPNRYVRIESWVWIEHIFKR